MKKEFKVWLEPEDYEKLRSKAEEMGFVGRGAVSHYVEKICKESICFLDSNVREVLRVLNLKTGMKHA